MILFLLFALNAFAADKPFALTCDDVISSLPWHEQVEHANEVIQKQLAKGPALSSETITGILKTILNSKNSFQQKDFYFDQILNLKALNASHAYVLLTLCISEVDMTHTPPELQPAKVQKYISYLERIERIPGLSAENIFDLEIGYIELSRAQNLPDELLSVLQEKFKRIAGLDLERSSNANQSKMLFKPLEIPMLAFEHWINVTKRLNSMQPINDFSVYDLVSKRLLAMNEPGWKTAVADRFLSNDLDMESADGQPRFLALIQSSDAILKDAFPKLSVPFVLKLLNAEPSPNPVFLNLALSRPEIEIFKKILDVAAKQKNMDLVLSQLWSKNETLQKFSTAQLLSLLAKTLAADPSSHTLDKALQALTTYSNPLHLGAEKISSALNALLIKIVTEPLHSISVNIMVIDDIQTLWSKSPTGWGSPQGIALLEKILENKASDIDAKVLAILQNVLNTAPSEGVRLLTKAVQTRQIPNKRLDEIMNITMNLPVELDTKSVIQALETKKPGILKAHLNLPKRQIWDKDYDPDQDE